MKQIRAFKFATICTTLFTGFALNACSDTDNCIDCNDEFGKIQSALSSVKVTKGAVSVRKSPGH